MKHLAKRTFISALTLAGFAVLTVWSVNTVSADQSASGGSGGHGGYNDYCTNYCSGFGVGWHYQTLDQLKNWPWDNGTNTGMTDSIRNEILSDCAAAGGFWRLSFERYEKYDGVTPTIVPNQYAGLVSVTSGQTWPYLTSGGGADWDTVMSDWKIADELEVTKTSWPNTSWFCFNPGWREEPDDPGPESGSGDSYFYSTTEATVSGLSDGPTLNVTTSPDGTSDIKFSTDDSSVTINFEHMLYYVSGIDSDPKDTFPNITTNWKVTTSGASYSASGSYTVNAKSSASSQVNSNSVTVPLAKGETKTVCQQIQYNPKYFSFGRNDIGWWEALEGGGWEWYHDYWEYFVESQSGSGISKVCVEITRPNDPTGAGPTSTGTMGSTLMYTGESATIGWSTNGPSYDTRRLAEWQAVVYQVPSVVGYNSMLTTSDPRYRGAGACGRYSGMQYRGCVILHGGSTGYSSHSYGPSDTIAVPDYVGDKYCNTFAYRYEYWYYITGQGWQHYSPPDYWYVYPSACRTIAKKPSTSIWNGSLLTNGSVNTSTSPRHQNPQLGDLAGSKITTYGSWAEYLDVIGGKVNGLGSGASFALGSGFQDVFMNSPLTITNNSSGNLGHSGVSSSTTFHTRLDTFLKDHATSDPGGTIGEWTNIEGTHILRHSGDLNITGNIKLRSNTTYSSIYQLPQVVLIVDGNVNISSNVEQIDAWIIATGTVNTCSNFVKGTTEADAIGFGNNPNPGDVCTHQLVFNGPVIADNLNLQRSFGSDPLIYYTKGTFGSDSERRSSAEVFNYRADNYLWAYAQAGRYHSSYTESYTRELAPRY